MKYTKPGTFGHALRMARFQRQMTCGDIAQLFGASKASVAAWERNMYPPSAQFKVMLRQVFPELADREELQDDR